MALPLRPSLVFFFFNDTATTEIYTLSLHDALPISPILTRRPPGGNSLGDRGDGRHAPGADARQDRKSTRLNSSHSQISYAVFCLKKKKKKNTKSESRLFQRHNFTTNGQMMTRSTSC